MDGDQTEEEQKGKRPWKRVNEEIKDRIGQLLEQGKTVAEIVREVNRSKTAV